MINAALVLTTVNAPYSKQLDAVALVYYLTHPAEATSVPGHMSSFFGDVEPELQLAFGELYGLTRSDLVGAAKAFADYSGEAYPLTA